MYGYPETMQATEVQRQYLVAAEQRRQLAAARRAHRRSRQSVRRHGLSGAVRAAVALVR